MTAWTMELWIMDEETGKEKLIGRFSTHAEAAEYAEKHLGEYAIYKTVKVYAQ